MLKNSKFVQLFTRKTGSASEFQLAAGVTLLLTLFYNFAFYRNTLKVYPMSWENIPFLVSLMVLFATLMVMLFTLFSSKYTIKPIVIFILMTGSAASCFMDSYDVVIDYHMYQNMFRTNSHEVWDLMTFRFALYVCLLGVVPSVLVWNLKINYYDLKTALKVRGKTFFVAIVIILTQLYCFNKFYTSYFREHKPLRYYNNPTYYVYSGFKYANLALKDNNVPLEKIGLDAKIKAPNAVKNLMLFVAGETARADRFSLNGYARETNPSLKTHQVINFPDFQSSFTATARSLPCMFSVLNRDSYSDKKGRYTENLLDILNRSGVEVLWRENNSGSQHIADRVRYEDFTLSETNPIHDMECRDEGMLAGLQEYINSHHDKNIFIVLHQMGNHGPAYYKRYPKSFEKFKPVMQTSQLNECTDEEIQNAYDNAILYTDYFLGKAIDLLRKNEDSFHTGLFYVSDHGESLGENGVYLHGLPLIMAPKAQTHVPAVLWLGKNSRFNGHVIREKSTASYSHDYIFHSMLRFMEVDTQLYNPELDIFTESEQF